MILTPVEYVQQHKDSFRVAFDFLNSHFPPGDSLEWWEQVSKDASEASIKVAENKLVIGLLGGILDYLEDEWRMRKDGTA